jgi:hypothetical protein
VAITEYDGPSAADAQALLKQEASFASEALSIIIAALGDKLDAETLGILDALYRDRIGAHRQEIVRQRFTTLRGIAKTGS